jgi:multidrug efflux pump subunit AcrB
MQAATEVRAVMATHPDVRGLHDNWNELRPTARISVDLARARELGVGPASLARTLEARFSSVVLGKYREADKLLPIEMRQPAQKRDYGRVNDRDRAYPAFAAHLVRGGVWPKQGFLGGLRGHGNMK